jgi:hypothetical protein
VWEQVHSQSEWSKLYLIFLHSKKVTFLVTVLSSFLRLFLCTQKMSTLLESVCVSVRPSVRPAVYTITLHNYIRLSWNFVHRTVSSISRSSSKMRRIRQEMTELSKKLSSLTRPSLRGGTGIFFQKQYSSQNYWKHISIDSVFNADSEYDISFEPNCTFLTKFA